MNAQSPVLLVDETFQDMGSCAKAVGWDFDFRQIEQGGIEAHLAAIGTKEVQIARYTFNRAIHQLGCPPADSVSFGFTGTQSPSLTWGGDASSPGSMLKFDQSGFDGVSPSGFSGFTVSIRPEFLMKVAEAQKINLEGFCASKPNAQWLSKRTRRASASLEMLYLESVRGARDMAPMDAELFGEELCSTIANEIGNTANTEVRRWRAHRARLLRDAQALLNDVDQLPITVSELCTQLGTSSSALNRLFHSEFGLSPKAYVRARCLSAVRDELALAPTDTRIADIANKWGFWHMGQFARDFRALFGELPSAFLTETKSTVRGISS